MKTPHRCTWHDLVCIVIYPLLSIDCAIRTIKKEAAALRAGRRRLHSGYPVMRLLRHYWMGYHRIYACQEFLRNCDDDFCEYQEHLKKIIQIAKSFYATTDIVYLRKIDKMTRWRLAKTMPLFFCHFPGSTKLYSQLEDETIEEVRDRESVLQILLDLRALNDALKFLSINDWFLLNTEKLQELKCSDKVILFFRKNDNKLAVQVIRKQQVYKLKFLCMVSNYFPKTGSFLGDFCLWRLRNLLENISFDRQTVRNDNPLDGIHFPRKERV